MTYRPFCGMFMDQAPLMSVVVVKRLPVSVFWAVTVTPGSGTLPLLITPCRLPPVTTGADSGEGTGWLAGVGSPGGDCASTSAQAPISTIQSDAIPTPLRNHSPLGVLVLMQTGGDVGRFTAAAERTSS